MFWWMNKIIWMETWISRMFSGSTDVNMLERLVGSSLARSRKG